MWSFLGNILSGILGNLGSSFIERHFSCLKFVRKNNNSNFLNLKQYLLDRGFQESGLPSNLETKGGYVIWPITLQPSATYIHTAQIQLIKLLVKAGWKLHAIIGDCGKHSATVKAKDFEQEIVKLLKANEISIKKNSVTLLSKYYQRNPEQNDDSLLQNISSLELLNSFHIVSNSVEWENYWDYVTKNYAPEKKKEIRKRKILSNLQPLLNWALVISITRKYSKTIVVAGEDEKAQWDNITNLHGKNKIGMIYIQELKDGNKTMLQSEIGIRNTNDMKSKLNNGNIGKWLYNHFVELPKFLTNQKPPFCKISDNECKSNNENCINCLFGANGKFDDVNFDKNAFVSAIYKIANPANAV